MKQERHEGGDPLSELWELEENLREATIEELESFLTDLRTKREEGEYVNDWISMTEQAIQIKIENGIDTESPSPEKVSSETTSELGSGQ